MRGEGRGRGAGYVKAAEGKPVRSHHTRPKPVLVYVESRTGELCADLGPLLAEEERS